VTRSICATCRGSLPSAAPYCPRCGPQSLTLIVSEETEAFAPAAEGEVAERIARALGPEFDVVRLVGRGGFAEVYEVVDTALQRRLAVKVVRPDLAWTAGVLARFKDEARSIARLSHPHTLPIYFVGEAEGLVFYTMPYVEGETLGALLRREGPLAPERVVTLALPVLDALAHAHRHGLVHRDIKPDNIMVESATGRVLLVDFGIAKRLDSDGPAGHQTQSGFVVGTPMYMSPEQALGQRSVDARSDLYSLGAVLWQMLVGAPPFDGQTSQEIVSRHLTEPVTEPSRARADVPGWLSDVVVRCMAKRPDDRFASAEAVADALRDGLAADGDAPTRQVPVATPASRAPWRFVRGGARMPGLVAAGVALVIAGGLGARAAARQETGLVIANGLAEPVRVTVAGGAARLVEPGDSGRWEVARGRAVEAEWRLVRPVGESGRVLGEELGGRRSETRPARRMRWSIDAGDIGDPHFAPIVSNRSAGPVRVAVVGPDGRAHCECVVPAGARDAHLGYYPLGKGTAVVVRDSGGREMRLDAARAAGARDGTLALEVSDASFAGPGATTVVSVPAPRAARGRHTIGGRSAAGPARPARGDTLRPPPDSAAPVAPPVPPADSTVAADSARDPLRGIFPNR